MKVLITHAYSTENKGDAALLDVLVQDVRRQYGDDCTIDILTIDRVDDGAMFAGVPLHAALMFYALNKPRTRLGKLFYAMTMMSYTSLWAWLWRYLHIDLPMPRAWRQVTTFYQQANIIITVGGGYFRTSGDAVTFINLLLMLHPLSLARRLGKPTFLYTMSVGPFYSGLERWLVTRQFRRLPLILIREETSRQLLADLGVSDNVVRSVDSGFLFDSQRQSHLRRQLGVPAKTPLVGVTARRWLDPMAQARYEQALAEALDHIIDTHAAAVVFIPQVTSVHNNDDDRTISRSIAQKMQHTDQVHVMQDDYDHRDVKAMYDELDYIIGTRFHSVIFSLTSHVPAIAIEYEHKTSGIMNDLELSDWTIKIEDVTAKNITTMFDRLVAERDTYRRHLQTVLPAYVDQAAEAIRQVDTSFRRLKRRRASEVQVK